MEGAGEMSLHYSEVQEVLKKYESLPFATTFLELESIILSKIRWTEKDKYHMIVLICAI